jgi:protein-disulfide isomerase
MASKRHNAKPSSGKQSARKSSGLPTIALIAAVVVVALIVVAALVVLDRNAGSSQPQAGMAPLERSYGAADAPVVVVEYADFQCPYCRQFAMGAEQQLRKDYADKGKVRFVFRHFPFIGEESLWAAEASECANAQGRFWDYHDKLFAEQGGENQGAFSRDNLKRFASELGLDTAQFNACLDSGQYKSQVQDEFNEARRLRIDSTPTILVDGHVVQNGGSYPVLQAAVEAALAGQ